MTTGGKSEWALAARDDAGRTVRLTRWSDSAEGLEEMAALLSATVDEPLPIVVLWGTPAGPWQVCNLGERPWEAVPPTTPAPLPRWKVNLRITGWRMAAVTLRAADADEANEVAIAALEDRAWRKKHDERVEFVAWEDAGQAEWSNERDGIEVRRVRSLGLDDEGGEKRP